MGRLGKLLIGVAIVGGLVFAALFVFRGPLAVSLMERVVTTNMTLDPIAMLDDGLHVGLCGAGSPLPDPARGGPCAIVIAKMGAQSRMFVVDTGAAGVRTLAQMQLPPGAIDAVLLTHFHSDHIDGLGELAMQRWVNRQATSPLPVHGPEGVERVVSGFNEAYAQDFVYRTDHHGADIVPPSGAGMVPVAFVEPINGEAAVVFSDADFDDADLKVIAFRVDHTPVSPAVGYRFDFAGRSLVISGDTVKSDNLIAFAKDVDLMLHEALAPQLVDILTRSARAAGRANIEKITMDILDYHTTPVEAAQSAQDANAAMLVFHHIVPALPIAPLQSVFLEGVSDAYDGPVVIGVDGDFWSLPAQSPDIRHSSRL